MRILIATAGELPPEVVAEFVVRLDGPRQVFVSTVIEVPRSFLDKIRSEGWHPLENDPPSPQDDLIAKYVDERGARIAGPMLMALRNREIEAETAYLEGVDPASTIVDAALDLEADLIVLGATKRLFAETHWESVTSRVIREAHVPVLVVPSPHRDDTGELDLPTSEFSVG